MKLRKRKHNIQVYLEGLYNTIVVKVVFKSLEFGEVKF